MSRSMTSSYIFDGKKSLMYNPEQSAHRAAQASTMHKPERLAVAESLACMNDPMNHENREILTVQSSVSFRSKMFDLVSEWPTKIVLYLGCTRSTVPFCFSRSIP